MEKREHEQDLIPSLNLLELVHVHVALLYVILIGKIKFVDNLILHVVVGKIISISS